LFRNASADRPLTIGHRYRGFFAAYGTSRWLPDVCTSSGYSWKKEHVPDRHKTGPATGLTLQKIDPARREATRSSAPLKASIHGEILGWPDMFCCGKPHSFQRRK